MFRAAFTVPGHVVEADDAVGRYTGGGVPTIATLQAVHRTTQPWQYSFT